MSSPIKPLGDRVVATKKEAKAKTAGGLFLPDQAKEKPVAAIIAAVGDDVQHVNVGDTILYKEYATTEIKINDIEYLIVKEEDILGTVA